MPSMADGRKPRGFAITFDGFTTFELKDIGAGRTPTEILEHGLSTLDGQDQSSLCLWALPDGISFKDYNRSTRAQDYMQAAGSADRLVVETRHLDPEGVPIQSAIGWRGAPAGGIEVVRYADHVVEVRENELLTSVEAIRLFLAYRQGAAIPSEFSLRRIHL